MAFRKDNYQESKTNFEKAISLDSSKDYLFKCWFFLSKANLRLGNIAEAQICSDSASVHSSDYESYPLLMDYYRYLGDCPWISSDKIAKDTLDNKTLALYKDIFPRLTSQMIDDLISGYEKSIERTNNRKIVV